MDKIEYWEIVVVKYPHLAREEEKTTLTVKGLRALLEQAWQKGHDQGFQNGKAWEQMNGKKSDGFEQLLKGFGL